MTLETISTVRSHGGTQGVYKHASTTTGTDMRFAVFIPDHAPGAKLPVLWYLSGLTCTHANVMEKGEYRAACAEQRRIEARHVLGHRPGHRHHRQHPRHQ